jgi:transcription elongation factor Elf1
MTEPCFRALQRLRKAKESVAECVIYKICPDCGHDLLVTSIYTLKEVIGLTCEHCKGKFDSPAKNFHHADPVRGI